MILMQTEGLIVPKRNNNLIDYICGHPACTFDINSKEDISAKEIVSKLCASGGAHKPTYYAFGNDEKIDLEFYAAENK